MEETGLYQILTSCYDDALHSSTAWNVYKKMVELCKDDDFYTIIYLYRLCYMDREEKLLWRTKIAEMGFELTPTEVDQYILIVRLALKSETPL